MKLKYSQFSVTNNTGKTILGFNPDSEQVLLSNYKHIPVFQHKSNTQPPLIQRERN